MEMQLGWYLRAAAAPFASASLVWITGIQSAGAKGYIWIYPGKEEGGRGAHNTPGQVTDIRGHIKPMVLA